MVWQRWSLSVETARSDNQTSTVTHQLPHYCLHGTTVIKPIKLVTQLFEYHSLTEGHASAIGYKRCAGATVQG